MVSWSVGWSVTHRVTPTLKLLNMLGVLGVLNMLNAVNVPNQYAHGHTLLGLVVSCFDAFNISLGTCLL